ncbi:MAG TPA: M15 family metallopeptidase [Candidatus Gastranaerophilaceae bacterium]|nr:M15 family metallopeptidase [Candidatus Gastranaerophilaceae bacterium]HPT41627.1 M15 family metallopeptidase [Candidatus Gastranaerophilaceae bacterium]
MPIPSITNLQNMQTDGAVRLYNPAAINVQELSAKTKAERHSIFTHSQNNIKNHKNPVNLRTKVNVNEVSYGFYKYDEVNVSSLSRLNSSSSVMGKPEAIRKLNELISEAQSKGITINLNYGFRSIETQRQLFYDQTTINGETQEQKIKDCAPPGFSEHHTGYAFDMSPSRQQDYTWLINNAPKYGFEMSYPQGNRQGVSYEPWHWRYVGNQESQNVFRYARVQAGIIR